MKSEEPETRKFQFSILSLLMLITSVAILFAGSRHFGAFGFAFGGFLMMISLGQMLDRRNWQIGGATAAVTLLCLLMASWRVFGTLEHMDYRYVGDVRDRFDVVDDWLEDFREKQGDYPERLLDLEPSEHVAFELYTSADAESSFDYAKTDSGYELTYLGEDKKVGGKGRDADLSPQAAADLGDTRVSFRAFLLETPGSGGLNLTLILSLILAVAIAGGLPSKHDQPKAAVIGVLAFALVAIIAGVVMAGLHIAVSQSGH